MTPEQIDMAASALVAARSGQPIAALPEAARPQSADEAYAIQDAVLVRLGERVGGWKVGVLPDGGNFVAPIYASRVHASPATLPARGFHVIGIECEIGFRIDRELPHRATASVDRPYTRDEVLGIVSMHPTIEVVDSRYLDFQSLDRLQVLADNFSNGGLVYGAAASGWQAMDLKHPPIAVTANGKDFAECTGLRTGDPIDLLITAVNLIVRRQGRAPAVGTLVTTGTHTGMVFTEPGADIRADYGSLGRVEVAFRR
jgi:2-keto-4-pentenoate hydratase